MASQPTTEQSPDVLLLYARDMIHKDKGARGKAER
jgi:hypothetical protein